jgi:hypothetical protein
MGGEWPPGTAARPRTLASPAARARLGADAGVGIGDISSPPASFQFIYPLFSGTPDLAWRVMFWVCIVPALFTLWIRSRVPRVRYGSSVSAV